MTTGDSIRRGLSWQYAGHVIEGVAGVLLMAYVVRHIEVQEYGLLLLAMSISSALMLLDLGLGSIFVRVFVKETVQGGESAASRALATAFLAMGGLGIIGLVICILLASTLPGPFRIPPELLADGRVIIFLAGLAVLINLPALALDSMFKAARHFSALTKIQLTAILCRVVLTVVAIEYGYGIVGLMIISVVTPVLRVAVAGISLPRVSGGIRLSLRERDWTGMRPLLRPATWAALENTGRQLAVPSGAILLGMFASMDAAAIFGVGSRIPMQIWALINRGTGVVLPILSRHDADGEEDELRTFYSQIARNTVIATTPVLIFMAVFAESIIEVWVGPQYLASATVMQWLCVTCAGITLSVPAYALLYGTGRIGTAARISLLETALYLAGAVILIDAYGAVGLAVASAISHVVVTVGWYLPRAVDRVHLSPWELGSEIFSTAWPTLLLFTIAAVLTDQITADDRAITRTLSAATIGAILYIAVWLPAVRSNLRRRDTNRGGAA